MHSHRSKTYTNICLRYVNTLLYCSRKMHSRLDVSVLRRRRQRVPARQYHREGLSDMVGRMYHVLVCQYNRNTSAMFGLFFRKHGNGRVVRIGDRIYGFKENIQ